MLAVKPFLGEVRNSIPSGFKPKVNNQIAPNDDLYIQHITGYRCHDARQTIFKDMN